MLETRQYEPVEIRASSGRTGRLVVEAEGEMVVLKLCWRHAEGSDTFSIARLLHAPIGQTEVLKGAGKYRKQVRVAGQTVWNIADQRL